MSEQLRALRNLVEQARPTTPGSPARQRVGAYVRQVCEDLESGAAPPEAFSIQGMAKATMGQEFVERCNPRFTEPITPLLEAGDGVDVTAFSNLTGALLSARILQGFNHETLVLAGLVETIPTRLDGEKMPGVEEIGDIAETVAPGMSFPNAGFGEDYIETTSTLKKGFIVPVTKEAVFFDRTGMVLRRAGQVGKWLGVTKEKMLADAIGQAQSSPTFAAGAKWKWKGTEYATYNDSAVDYASYFYVNLAANNLTDHTDVQEAELLLEQMTDPNISTSDKPEPIDVGGTRTLLIPPNLLWVAQRIANATEVRTGGSASGPVQLQKNAYMGLNIVKSTHLYNRLVAGTAGSAAAAAKYWYFGDFYEAFAWMENWPLQTRQAPPNAEAEFKQDTIAQYRADFRGIPAVKAPQYVTCSTGT